MLKSNIHIIKGLIDGNIGIITEIFTLLFRRDQIYDKDLPSVHIDFGLNGVHMIKSIAKEFPPKSSYVTAVSQTLPIILGEASIVHKMRG